MSTIYLTKININVEELSKYRANTNYIWHQKLWNCFDNQPKTEPKKQPFIYKTRETQNGVEILMMSKTKPEKATFKTFKTIEIIPENLIKKNKTYIFELEGAPTFRKNKNDYAFYKKEDQIKWLERKGQQYGFKILKVEVENAKFVYGKNSQNKNGEKRKAKKFSANFKGIIQCENTETFTEAFTNGIGRGKSLGLGLISLIPINQ